MKMTPKQNRFCIEFGKDFDPLEAAIRAGYSPGTVSRTVLALSTNQKVLDKVRELYYTRHINIQTTEGTLAQVSVFTERFERKEEAGIK